MNTADPRPDNRLRLNRDGRKLLGVCSGFARYLDVPVALIRLIYVIACVVSPALVFVYFVLYWLLDEDDNPSKMRVYVSDSKPAAHFKRIDYRRPLYRNKKKGWIGGVCAGIAEYMGIKPALVRLVALLSLFVFGGATLWAYIACWIVLDKKPRGFSYRKKKDRGRNEGLDDEEEEELEQTEEPVDPLTAMQHCADTLHRSEARLRELEAFMTSRKFRLHCEINRI